MADERFVLMGAAGYIAPRHMKAIKAIGGRIVAACDPHDSVGILDQFGHGVEFFTEEAALVDWLKNHPGRATHMSVCSPNHLHTRHTEIGLRAGLDVVCEKPMVVDPADLDVIKATQDETGGAVWAVLQLRLHPVVRDLRERFQSADDPANVNLTYVTPRGRWYHRSWKGDLERSGGLAMNIGIHFFDMLLWIFGACGDWRVHEAGPDRIAGGLKLKRATVEWILSIRPQDVQDADGAPTRSMEVDGERIEFSRGFSDLHTAVYHSALAGDGWGVEDVRPALELVSAMTNGAERT